MPDKIFVNYRRGDDPGFTQALYQRLEDEFPAGDLFMDVEGHIKPGDDFVEVLRSQVAACDVLLAVIGPRWAELLAARLSDTDDFVGIEIKAALDQGKRVIPVLVGGAGMPRADTLPAAIRPLARRNAVGLRPERFKTDCQGLVTALKEHLASAERERAARTEAERAAAEAERQKREAEEAARIAAAEERARAQTLAGLSAEEIRKAEELANWDFVKDRNDIQDLRDHLARFPAGTTERYALARLDGLVWAALGPTPGVDQLRDYLDEFPRGAHAEAAQVRIARLEMEAAQARAAGPPPLERAAGQPIHWGPVIAGLGLLVLGAGLAYLWQPPPAPAPEPQAKGAPRVNPVAEAEAARQRAAAEKARQEESKRAADAAAAKKKADEEAQAKRATEEAEAARQRATAEKARQEESKRAADAATEKTKADEGARAQAAENAKQDKAKREAEEAAAKVVLIQPPVLVPRLEPAAPLRAAKPLTATEERALKPKDSFSECDGCPEMVVVQAGEFMMGSNDYDSEKPQRKVIIARPFAVGKFEVTFIEWEACVAGGGCVSNPRPSDRRWGRGKRPVINVRWEDAKEYVAWLSRKTGKVYRLLSEAEWEYAARAGTATEYAFGDTITKTQAHFGGRIADGTDRTVEVGSFQANKFGLHDMHGNVWEWCEDKWHPSYQGTPPIDGSVWSGGDTVFAVLRGGSWSNMGPTNLRSANRLKYLFSDRNGLIGFRVARTL